MQRRTFFVPALPSRLAIVMLLCPLVVQAEDAGKKSLQQADSTKQVAQDIQYLASDKLKGRQPGTAEMKLAEDYIIQSFKDSGLSPGVDGEFRQTFDLVDRQITQTTDPETTHLRFITPNGKTKPLAFNDQYVPMGYQETYALKNLPVVFVGYGIDADREHNYNDYRDVDVEGKAVVLIRGEPQQKDPNSVFDGDDTSRYSYLQTKIAAAVEAKAAAIIMVNDAERASENDNADPLATTSQFGRVTNRIPFLHLKREVLNQILADTPVMTAVGVPLNTIDQIESEIDATLEPLTQTIVGWQLDLATEFVELKTATSNIIGIVEGVGSIANETIVVGAHYDHLGMGDYGSRSRDAGKAIHNGADDNATGTAAVMALAKRLAKKRAADPPVAARRVIFICFTAEELGLLGAKHYVNNPVVPINQTVAMINFDMIGYLRENSVEIFGWDSAATFETLLNKANQSMGLTLVKPASRFVGSDHMPFDQKKIPNVFFHTGLNAVYHTPDDDFEAINVPGAVKVIDLAEQFLDQLATMEAAPPFVSAAALRKRVRLGVMVKTVPATNQLEITEVAAGSIAEKSGIQPGDKILSFNGKTNINNDRRLSREIKRGTGKIVDVILDRGGDAVILTVDLQAN